MTAREPRLAITCMLLSHVPVSIFQHLTARSAPQLTINDVPAVEVLQPPTSGDSGDP